MHTKLSPERLCLLAAGLFLLAACGGGGGGSSAPTPTPPPPPPTPPPGGMVVVSGKLTFDSVPHNTSTSGLNYNAITQKPIRGATVQAVNPGTGATLAATTSDALGQYSLTVTANTTMSLRVLAEMKKADAAPTWDFQVVDNTSNKALYSLSGSTFDSGSANQTRDLNATSGWGGTSYTGTRAAGPFAILDAAYQAYTKVLSADASASFPALKLNWSVNNVPTDGNPDQGQIGTSHYTSNQIFILGAANNDTDEYDDHVVIHEWGHYFEDNFSRSDSIGGSHGGSDKLDMRVAFGEGWGNAWSGMATDDPFYRDSAGNAQGQGFAINVDNSNPGTKGWYSESSVQAILYDLYDGGVEANDPVNLGFGPIYAIMTGAQKSTAALTSIFSFVTPLRAANPVQSAGIDLLLSGQNIVAAGMDIFGSTETDDGGITTDVLPVYADYTTLGVNQPFCVNDTAGEYNKLGNVRYVRLTIPSAGTYRVTLNRGATGNDPDFVVYQNAQVAQGFDGPGAQEIKDVSLKPGTAIIAVTEATESVSGRVCMNLLVSM